MNREIIFKREEYKEKYNGLMQSYLLEYEDYEEIDFVNNEIKRYNDFIADLDWLIMCKLAEASGVPIDHQRLIDFRLEKKCVINFPDLIDDQNEKLLILSFNKIIDFLELQKINQKPTQNIKIDKKGFEDVSIQKPTKAKDYKCTIWFKTGIPLATGEAFKLYRKYKNDKGYYKKICLELGFKETDRPYFSETIIDQPRATDKNKNTFADKGKLQKLHNHLTENGLEFGAEFLEKYNALELE